MVTALSHARTPRHPRDPNANVNNVARQRFQWLRRRLFLERLAPHGRTPPSHQQHDSIHDGLRWSFAEMVGIPRYGRGKSQVDASLRRAIAGQAAIDHRNSKRTFLREKAEYIQLYNYIIIFSILYLYPISLSWSRSRQSLPANRAGTLSDTQRKTPSKPTAHRSPQARAASQHRRACASRRAARA